MPLGHHQGPGTGQVRPAREQQRELVSRRSGEVARGTSSGNPARMALRARDPAGFADAMLARELVAFEAAVTRKSPGDLRSGLCHDIVGFLALAGLPGARRTRRILTCATKGPIFARAAAGNLRIDGPELGRMPAPAIARYSAAWGHCGYSLIDLPLELARGARQVPGQCFGRRSRRILAWPKRRGLQPSRISSRNVSGSGASASHCARMRRLKLALRAGFVRLVAGAGC